jgi:hypothetical protein
MAACIIDLQAAMAAMSEDPCNRSRLYLTDRELAALPCMAHDTVFAVRTAGVLECCRSGHICVPCPASTDCSGAGMYLYG